MLVASLEHTGDTVHTECIYTKAAQQRYMPPSEIEQFRDAVSPKYHLLDTAEDAPAWATVTEPPADLHVDSEYVYDLLDAVEISTAELPSETINEVACYAPPTIEHLMGELRVRFDESGWPRVSSRLEREDDISTKQARRAAQRVHSAVVVADPDWTDAYNDVGIDEQHHGLGFDDLDGEIETIDTVLGRIKQMADTVEHPPVDYPEVRHTRFRLLTQLIRGEIEWEVWAERDPMVSLVEDHEASQQNIS